MGIAKREFHPERRLPIEGFQSIAATIRDLDQVGCAIRVSVHHCIGIVAHPAHHKYPAVFASRIIEEVMAYPQTAGDGFLQKEQTMVRGGLVDIEQLPPGQREVVKLHKLRGMSMAEPGAGVYAKALAPELLAELEQLMGGAV